MSEDTIDAALWETDKSGKAVVLKISQAQYSGEWEKAIDAADKAISEIETDLPDGVELTKVVFGLFPEWLSEDHIKEIYLKKLKQLTTALSLTPVGFVELPVAVAHLLSQDEGAQQTVILVGIESKHVTVSLFKIGKLIGSKLLDRSAMISSDIEKGLGQFTDVEVLPSRMLLYGTVLDLEQIKADLLSYPWQQKANFLHFPKIEPLLREYPVKAVAIASASELVPTASEEESVPAVSSAVAENAPKPPVFKQTTSEVSAIAADLGFVQEKDAASFETPNTVPIDEDEILVNDQEVSNVQPISVPAPALTPRPSKFALPKLSFTVKLPGRRGIWVAAAVIILLLGSAGITSAIFWYMPKATVTILVTPKLFDKTEELTVDTSTAAPDSEHKVLPGHVEKLEVSGTQTLGATGKKTVGDHAKGEIAIFNKTLNPKTFKKGAVVSSGKLAFTLDADTSLTAATESGDSLKYGSSKAGITASDIGTASNLPADSDFAFSGLPASSYSARNEKAVSGGTSRDILVVTRDDLKNLKQQALMDLESKAAEELKQKLTDGQKLLEDSLQTEVQKETYTKEIGEEATEVSVNLTVSASGATYNEKDFYALLDKVISSQISADFNYRKEDTQITLEDIVAQGTGIWKFKPHITGKLLPKVDTNSFAQHISGKTLEAASGYLKSQTGVSGVEYSVEAPFGFLRQKLPANAKRINITLASL